MKKTDVGLLAAQQGALGFSMARGGPCQHLAAGFLNAVFTDRGG